MDTADKIKQARFENRFTQKELAKIVGAATATINKIETGEIKKTSIDIALKIANALNKNIYYLFGDNGNNSTDLYEVQNQQLIEKLQSENEALKKQLANYEVLIELMKDKLKQ